MILKNLHIKKIREELGLTQQELASVLEVNIRTVQKWESGESKIRKGTSFMLNELRNKGVNNSMDSETNIYLEKDGVKFSVEEISVFVVKNIDVFRTDPTFKLMYERDVQKGVNKELKEIIFRQKS